MKNVGSQDDFWEGRTDERTGLSLKEIERRWCTAEKMCKCGRPLEARRFGKQAWYACSGCQGRRHLISAAMCKCPPLPWAEYDQEQEGESVTEA